MNYSIFFFLKSIPISLRLLVLRALCSPSFSFSAFCRERLHMPQAAIPYRLLPELFLS